MESRLSVTLPVSTGQAERAAMAVGKRGGGLGRDSTRHTPTEPSRAAQTCAKM